ncbi:hypothetical protein KVT40_000235 [Elsinoe batatas]|uniref:Autophagy-related protein 28 n=1 Tax=Elsinoe batatas TaxID=2601811 RepID=A0A8K0PG89_9PEZI|nr:hypothetical protein KVT40_000235 [Elsinoe batatas]
MDNSWIPSKLRSSLPKMPLAPIPPPITASIFLPTRPPPSPLPQKPWYHRKAASLESDLQLLLDAQAASLSNPLSSPSPSPAPSSASSTTSFHPSRTKKIPLRQARAGLYTTMRRLAALKDEEVSALVATVDSVAGSHEQLLAWTEQRTKLRERTEQIASSEDVDRAKELREQAEGLQPDIRELEDRLAKLRNEQRRLTREADEVANRVEGKVAGYTRRLEGVEREVRSFLEGLGREGEVVFDQDGDGEEEEGFWAAPKRRTLEMAVDVIGKERERAEGRLDVVETEREALLEGAVVWKDVIRLVEGFEKGLREDMHNSRNNPGSSEQLKDTLARMDEVVEQLESQIALSETKGWKLLIAAIGAELDAFLKGKDVLQQALEAIEGPRDRPFFEGTDDDDEEQGVNSVIRSPPATRKDDQESHDGKIEALDHAFTQRPTTNGSHDTDEDDDGPDPELMISHHDTDTD